MIEQKYNITRLQQNNIKKYEQRQDGRNHSNIYVNGIPLLRLLPFCLFTRSTPLTKPAFPRHGRLFAFSIPH